MKKSPLFVPGALLTITLLLTSCATVSSPPKASPSLNLYQPPVLRLRASQPVQTVDGVYTPVTAETWHSDTRFRLLEAQIEALSIANAQLRNAPRP